MDGIDGNSFNLSFLWKQIKLKFGQIDRFIAKFGYHICNIHAYYYNLKNKKKQ